MHSMVIHMVASDMDAGCAEKIMLATTDAYAAPNKTIPVLREIVASGVGLDPLKDFAEAARAELVSPPGPRS